MERLITGGLEMIVDPLVPNYFIKEARENLKKPSTEDLIIQYHEERGDTFPELVDEQRRERRWRVARDYGFAMLEEAASIAGGLYITELFLEYGHTPYHAAAMGASVYTLVRYASFAATVISRFIEKLDREDKRQQLGL